MRKLGRFMAFTVATTTAAAALAVGAGPAFAHQAHSSAYTSGSHNACLGAGSPTASRFDDFWWGHLADTSVALVRGSNCLYGTTTTWSDNYWTGFTNNVFIEIYDYWGQLRWSSKDHAKLKFGVAGTQYANHARKDLYTFALPAEVAAEATRIKVTQLEGCCL